MTRHRLLTLLSALALASTAPLPAQTPSDVLENLMDRGVTVDLRNPVFSEGVLSTDEGGVVSSGDFRLQARRIRYTRKQVDGETLFCVEAEGDLMILYGDYAFVGDYAEYNFETRTGLIYHARTALANWYVSGDVIHLHDDASYTVEEANISSCEEENPHWKISSSEVHIDNEHNISAGNIKASFANVPIFWFPRFRVNADSFMESPLSYRFAVGGHRRVQVGVRYQVFSWQNFKVFLVADYRIKPGPGGGFETEYEDGRTCFFTRNYLAYDRSDFRETQDGRYRVQGEFSTTTPGNCTTIEASWDRMSDPDVATDYEENTFHLRTADRTELQARHQTSHFISKLYSRLRINPWETVKQEIPHFKTRARPLNLGRLGIYSDLLVQAGYLDYRFANEFPQGSDYNSVRFEMRPRLWMPLHYGAINITPELGYSGTYYSKAQTQEDVYQAVGRLAAEANTWFHRYYGSCKHLLKPYVQWEHITAPTIDESEVHIFGIQDGWHRLNRLTAGLSQRFVMPSCIGYLRSWGVELWAHAFLDTNKTANTVPHYYARFHLNPTACFHGQIDSAWDSARSEVAYLNLRGEFTYSENFALAGEFRHRSAYSWRKAERDSYILDVTQSENTLLASSLSDKRDTFLLHAFYRLSPMWALEWESRHGWNRQAENDYFFYQLSTHARLHCGWHVRVSYQHREHDDRVTFQLHLKPQPPGVCDYELTDYLR